MTTLILDIQAEQEILADRRAKGLDRFDEVWDGVYVMSPLANNEHQKLASRLSTIMDTVVGMELGGTAFCGCNISNLAEDWKFNYRCPDVAVFLAETEAHDRGAHWQGGPDFAIEITSPGDQTWKKLDFYAEVGTRELLIVERDPWEIVLLRLVNTKLVEVGRAKIGSGVVITSAVVPFSFSLISKDQRPAIEVKHLTDGRKWQAVGDLP